VVRSEPQDITRLIAVPLHMDDRSSAFWGRQSRYSIHDDSQIGFFPIFWSTASGRTGMRPAAHAAAFRLPEYPSNVGVGLWIILLDKEPAPDRCWLTTTASDPGPVGAPLSG
jgi:hypothetical protein